MKKILKTFIYSVFILIVMIILNVLCNFIVAFIDGLTGYDLISKKYIVESLYLFLLIFLVNYFDDKFNRRTKMIILQCYKCGQCSYLELEKQEVTKKQVICDACGKPKKTKTRVFELKGDREWFKRQ